MEPASTRPGGFRFRLRTLLIVVALAGLFLALVAREIHLRNELELARARAEANFDKARAAVDQYFTHVAEQSVVAGPRTGELRRDLLEAALKFYRGAVSKASSPDERAKILDRMQKIQTELDGNEQSDEEKP
jgi:hypothetical protein